MKIEKISLDGKKNSIDVKDTIVAAKINKQLVSNLLYKTNTSNYYYCRSRILRKGKSDLSFTSKEYIESLETKSSLAKKLKEVALNIDNKDISPFIRIDFLQQIYSTQIIRKKFLEQIFELELELKLELGLELGLELELELESEFELELELRIRIRV